VLGRAYPSRWGHVVAAELPDGTRCVLKRSADPAREVAALRLLGPACVQLVAERDDGLLLERVEPGTPLEAGPDHADVRAVAAVLPRLWAPVPAGCDLPDLDQECGALADPAATRPLPAELVRAARERLAALLETAPPALVLHGDLHHGNLLDGGDRGLVAIDPHGVVGDPAYDVGPLLINPLGRPDVPDRAVTRAGTLSRLLALPYDRVVGWGLVRAVLSAAWTVQDGGVPQGGPLEVARRLAVATRSGGGGAGGPGATTRGRG
jgi:streptomycin 6-kinase